MAKTRLEKIDGIDEEIALLRRRQALLKQQQGKQERKERTHRLCRRAGLIEKLLPGVAALTDGQFEAFVEKTLMTGYAERILKGLAPAPAKPTDESGNGSGDGCAADGHPAKPDGI